MVRLWVFGSILGALLSTQALGADSPYMASTESVIASMPAKMGGDTLSTSVRNSRVYFCRQIKSFIKWNGVDRVWLHQNRPADKNGGWLGLVSPSGDISWQMAWEGQPPLPQKIWEDGHGRVIMQGKDQYDKQACIERPGFNLN